MKCLQRCKKRSNDCRTFDAASKKNKTGGTPVKRSSPSPIVEADNLDCSENNCYPQSDAVHLNYLPASSPQFIPHVRIQDPLLAAKMAIKRGSALIISGLTGCGKTVFVKHLSRIFNAELIVVQVSEQTDSKASSLFWCFDILL